MKTKGFEKTGLMNIVHYSVGHSVNDSVNRFVWNSVRDSVMDSVRGSVWNSAVDFVGRSVWDGIRRKICELNENKGV